MSIFIHYVYPGGSGGIAGKAIMSHLYRKRAAECMKLSMIGCDTAIREGYIRLCPEPTVSREVCLRLRANTVAAVGDSTAIVFRAGKLDCTITRDLKRAARKAWKSEWLCLKC